MQNNNNKREKKKSGWRRGNERVGKKGRKR
jgi:hypothetical protein